MRTVTIPLEYFDELRDKSNAKEHEILLLKQEVEDYKSVFSIKAEESNIKPEHEIILQLDYKKVEKLFNIPKGKRFEYVRFINYKDKDFI